MRRLSDRSEGGRCRRSRLMAALGAMLLVAATQLAADNAAAIAVAPERSCFEGGSAERPSAQAQAVERATLFIALVRADGTLLSQGTGFVAASRPAGQTGSLVVTASHVVQHDGDLPSDARLIAFFSDGAVIGALRVIAAGPQRNLSFGGFDIVADDVAVAEIAQFADPRAEARFSQLRGLPLAASDRIAVGEASDPVGAIWGFSGAAAVDTAGRVVGVLTGASFRGRVTLELGSVQESNAAGAPRTRAVTLPTRSLIVVEPLQAQAVRAALGDLPREAPAPDPAVLLAGFPLASCATTAATLASVDSPAGAALLSRWQKAGPVGAWFLPPSLDQTKLKLAP